MLSNFRKGSPWKLLVSISLFSLYFGGLTNSLNFQKFRFRFPNKIDIKPTINESKEKAKHAISIIHDIFILIVEASDIRFDISAGAGTLSAPEKVYETEQERLISIPIQAHKITKRVISALPDAALVALLVLMSSDLLKREVAKSTIIPSHLKEFISTTDEKLENLIASGFQIDPFVKAELEALQLLPFEAIDRYIVQEILPKIDKELSPHLSKMIGDPEKVTAFTNNIKNLVEVTNYLLTRSEDNNYTQSVTTLTTATILETVDTFGAGLEEVMKNWNVAIENITKLMRVGSIKHIVWTPIISVTPPRFPDKIDDTLDDSRKYFK